MATKAKKKAGRNTGGDTPTPDGWVMRHWGQEAPSYKKLNEAIAALKCDEPISREMREYVACVLDYLYVWLHIEEREHTRGRRENIIVTMLAWAVKELHDKHHIKIAAAVSAMVREDFGTEGSRRKARQNIERAYRKIKNRMPYPGGEGSRVVLDALARINPRKPETNR
jgi:hypothetical protein